MTIPPEPPVDVRLVLRDDTEIPVQCVYHGLERGTYVWEVVEQRPRSQIKGAKIGMLPPHTEVRIVAKGDGP